MDLLNSLGFGADIDALESYVAELQDAAGMGNPIVPDSMYDTYFKLLKQLKPESKVLGRNWESEDNELDEYDEILKKYGMSSITTINSIDEVGDFEATVRKIGKPVTLMASVKENGHAVRAVYLNGYLYSGSTRGRYKKGRDITRHLKIMLPNYVEAWKNIPIVEIRGEALVSIDNFEKYLKGTLKHPLSSVTSIIRASASDEEIKMLDFVGYKVISSDGSLHFDSLWSEYEHLKACGFKTPQKVKIENVTADRVREATAAFLQYFEALMDKGDIKYSCDGIVIAINDDEIFYGAGRNGNAWNGNFALKTGRYWQSNIYSAEIQRIEFIPGKTYLVPKAIIDPVTTSNGAEVTTVPLYNIGVMERYGYVPGETIYFRFGGEQGVSCCDVYGNSVQANGS